MTRVVVVGAGILGALHARRALALGCEVLHLERELVARGASVRNFGLVWVSGRPSGEELRFALRSRSLWEEVAAEIPEVGFRANGSITVLRDDAHVRVAEQVDGYETRALRLLDPDEVREANPALRGAFAAGLHCALDAAVEPRRAADAIRTANARDPRYTWSPGRHVVSVGDRFVEDGHGERYEADVVVLCPGSANGLLGWRPDLAPLRRVRLQMLETQPYERAVTTSVADWDSLRYYPAFDVPARSELPAPEPVVAERHVQLLLQQRLDGALTIGDTHDYDEPFDVSVDEAPYEHLLRRAEEILGTPLPPVRRRWAGVYSQATDDRLYHLEQVGESAWVATGAGGRGMTLAPAIAEATLERCLAGR